MTMILGPRDGEAIELGGLGVRYLTRGEGFSLVEHPIAPRTLAAPMHVHRHEDEYSYVLADIAPLLPPHRPEPDFAALAATQDRYGLEMDMSTIETISRREGLQT